MKYFHTPNMKTNKIHKNTIKIKQELCKTLKNVHTFTSIHIITHANLQKKLNMIKIQSKNTCSNA